MSETSGQQQDKQKSSIVKRKTQRDSVLTPTFAASRQNSTSAETAKTGSGAAVGAPVRHDKASELQAVLASGHDFSRIPAHSVTPSAAKAAVQIPGSQSSAASSRLKPGVGRGQGGGQVLPPFSRRASPVMRHLQTLPGRPGFDTSLYRKEIAEFQHSHPQSRISAGQEEVLAPREKVEVRQRDNSQTLRRCGNGRAAPGGERPADRPASVPIFSAGTFGPAGEGAITAKSQGDQVMIAAPRYVIAGTVRASGGYNEEARKWSGGFFQTMKEAHFTAHYKGSPQYKEWGYDITGPRRDALDDAEPPWYKSAPMGKVPFGGSNTDVAVELWDAPDISPTWDTPDKKGKLHKTEGRVNFVSWMVAKREGSNTIDYLKWAAWDLDWGADLDYDAKTGRATTGKTSTTARGGKDDKAPASPQLTGKTALNELRERLKTPWKKSS